MQINIIDNNLNENTHKQDKSNIENDTLSIKITPNRMKLANTYA